MSDDLYHDMLNDGIIREDGIAKASEAMPGTLPDIPSAEELISKMVERIAFLSQRLADAEAALAAAMAGAVRVKPLEWMGTYDDRGDGTAEHNGGYEAETPFGIYEIPMGCGPDGYYWSVSDEAGNEVASDDDIETAQTSGQSDVARRILAALEPNPAAQDREALIEVLTARATAAEAALAAAMEGAVRVKPLEWFEVARGNNGYGKWEAEGYVVQKIEGLFLINFAGSYKNEWRFTSVGSAKAAAEADYNRRILAALEPNPAAQDREAALIVDGHGVYLTHAELAARDGALIVATLSDIDLIEQCISDVFREGGTDREAASHVAAALATQPQTDALAAVRREARAEVWAESAEIVTKHSDKARRKLANCRTEGHPEDEATWGAIVSHLDIAHDAILAAAQKEAEA